MKRRPTIFTAIALCALAALSAGILVRHKKLAQTASADRLLLLVPDGISFSDPRVTVWLDAGDEQGLDIVPMHDSGFLNPVSPLIGNPQFAGVILPDTIHARAGDLITNAIRSYVSRGGKLMLVYDAATESLGGFYTKDQAPLSDVVGVKYQLYSSLAGRMTESAPLSGPIAVLDELGVPPGKYYPLGQPGIPASADTETAEQRRYEYGDLEYSNFVTAGNYGGQVLLRSHAGLVAGYRQYGQGTVLFVNLPLGFLASYTDGLPLHSFLTFFATKVLSLPYLMPVPDGIGGIVLDWHVDYAGAIKPLQEMDTWTIVQQGPYSVDFTAGPDDNAIGDREGLDVPHNTVVQDLIRHYEQLGYEIGSHGGWLHNYFAAHLDDTNAAQMQQYLALNNAAIERITGKPVREYSAPVGNHPQWVTEWLARHGVVAYYFTGDTGMGPTLGYRHGLRAGTTIWAFPILHLDRAATFEEMPKYGYTDEVVEQWLDEATDFVANHRQVRLIYFHPPGIVRYHAVVDRWMEKTAQLKAAGTFRWYTMPQIADFLNIRKKVQWTVREVGSSAIFEATDPMTLAHQTWRLPKSSYSEPRIISGNAQVSPGENAWFVVGGSGTRLAFESRLVNK
ncbi:MAG TPA: polysaccharide deacetylase family protein [Candidatus Acidoferrum sp.]|nr:polysaccharide deacetylase family protein [Candidatus Acidoferrum sp.]